MGKWVIPKVKPVVLSPRQKEVLIAWWIGEPLAQTEARLGIKQVTIKLYRRQVRYKLNAPTIHIACKRALRKGLIHETARPRWP
jgi:DNA-binding CsgD family transcriptional regulator